MARVEYIEGPAPAGAGRRRHLVHLVRHQHAVTEPVIVRHVAEVRRVRLWSVAKLALVFSFGIGCVLALATLISWQLLMGAGILPNVEQLIGELVGEPEWRFDGAVIMRGIVLGLTSFALVATSLSIVAAMFYNLMAPVVGGIEIEMRELCEPAEAQRDDDDRDAADHTGNGNGNGHADGSIVIST